jgi:hypothetical protein
MWKGSLPNRKSTSQNKVNKKNHTAYSDIYPKAFPNSDSPESLPNIEKYLLNLLVKSKLNPMVWFRVMFNSIKLDCRIFYAKI